MFFFNFSIVPLNRNELQKIVKVYDNSAANNSDSDYRPIRRKISRFPLKNSFY